MSYSLYREPLFLAELLMSINFCCFKRLIKHTCIYVIKNVVPVCFLAFLGRFYGSRCTTAVHALLMINDDDDERTLQLTTEEFVTQQGKNSASMHANYHNITHILQRISTTTTTTWHRKLTKCDLRKLTLHWSPSVHSLQSAATTRGWYEDICQPTFTLQMHKN